MEILSINEWKESDNYIIGKWYNKLKYTIEDWFNDDMYKQLKFDDYTYDVFGYKQIYIGILNFNENEKYQYKLELIVDPLLLDKEQEDILLKVTEIDIKFYIYESNSTELIGELELNNISTSEIVPDLLLGLITDIKKEYNIQ